MFVLAATFRKIEHSVFEVIHSEILFTAAGFVDSEKMNKLSYYRGKEKKKKKKWVSGENTFKELIPDASGVMWIFIVYQL